MGLEDDVLAASAAERQWRETSSSRQAASRRRRDEFIREFIALCLSRHIPPIDVTLVHEHNQGVGRFLRELVGANSTRYSFAGSVKAWGPLVERESEFGNTYIAFGADGVPYRIASAHDSLLRRYRGRFVSILEDRASVEESLDYRIDTIRESAIQFFQRRSR